MGEHTGKPRGAPGGPTDYLALFLISSLLLALAWLAQWDPARSDAIFLTANGHLMGSQVPFQARNLFIFVCPCLLVGVLAGLLGLMDAFWGPRGRKR